MGGSHVVPGHLHSDGVHARREDQHARGARGREEPQLIWRRCECETEIKPPWVISLHVSRAKVGLTCPFEEHGCDESRRGRDRSIRIPDADLEQPAAAVPRCSAAAISDHDVAEVSRHSPRIGHVAHLVCRRRVEVQVKGWAPDIALQPWSKDDRSANHVPHGMAPEDAGDVPLLCQPVSGYL